MRGILTCLLLCLGTAHAALAGEQNGADGDELVRLPVQQGSPTEAAARAAGLPGRGERLVAGGVLLLGFDMDGDGLISAGELDEGLAAAFSAGDQNGDGLLTALEQQAWAASLPVRDDTLANPVRFDPNLDRVVTREEFSAVILQLAAGYQTAGGSIASDDLIVRDRTGREDKRLAEGRAPLPR